MHRKFRPPSDGGRLVKTIGADEYEVKSAGVAPSRVRPEAIEAMREIGIDISKHRSKSVDEFAGQNFEYVITVCDNANEICPVFSGNAKRIHYSFVDPPPEIVGDKESRTAIFRQLRGELKNWLIDFVTSKTSEI